jgi:hypothetical protein
MQRLAKLLLVGMFMALGFSAKAQTPTYHPGDTVTVSIAFDGPDADKITSAAWNLSTPKTPNNEAGFSPSLYCSTSKVSGPKTFDVSCKIPNNQSSGEYQITELRGAVDSLGVTLFYERGTDEVPIIVIRIDNSHMLTKPSIKSVKVLP